MTPITYPAHIEETGPHEFLVTFPDIPEALTDGATRAEAEANAADALSAALEGYLELGRDFPAARPAQKGEAEIALDPAIAARGVLVRAMTAQHLSKVALAQRMGRDEKVIRRIISGKGASLDLTLQALRAVGIRAALAA
jgi:antitoxin HicB